MPDEELTKRELKEILDTVLREIDVDPDDGPRLSAAAAPLRIEFPDLKLVLNVSRADSGRHCLRLELLEALQDAAQAPALMESAVANRVFQGRENPAIAIARGRLRTSVDDAGAALRFFPAAKPLFARYREVVAEKYPHLALTRAILPEVHSSSRIDLPRGGGVTSSRSNKLLGRKRVRGPQVPRRLGSATGLREASRRRWPTRRADSPQATGSWGPVALWRDRGALDWWRPGMSPDEANDEGNAISLAEASRLAGMSSSTLKRWADEGLVPVQDGRWTRASAAQARVIARMRERGYSVDAIREAARGGRLAFGYAEDLFQVPEGRLYPRAGRGADRPRARADRAADDAARDSDERGRRCSTRRT